MRNSTGRAHRTGTQARPYIEKIVTFAGLDDAPLLMKTPYKNLFTGAAFVAMAVGLTLLLPNKGKFRYEYQKGQPWMYDNLSAPFDFPLLKSEEEVRREREAISTGVHPCFIFRNQIEVEQLHNLSRKVHPAPDSSALFEQVVKVMNDIYLRGIISRETPLQMPPDGVVTLVQGMESYERPVAELFDPVTAEAWLARMLTPMTGKGREQLLINRWGLREYLVPNLQYDEKTTLAIQYDKLSDIAPAKGRIYTGTLIAAKGVVLDDETVQILDSFKAEYNRAYGFSGNRIVMQLGQFIAMLLCALTLYILILFLAPDILKHKSFLLFNLLQMPVMLLTAILLGNLNAGGLYMIPFVLFALYTAAFFPPQIAFPFYLVGLLPIALMAPHGVEWFFLSASAGAVAVFVFNRWNRGWLQFLSAVILFLTYTAGYVAFRLIENGSFAAIDWRYLQYFCWNALLVIAGYPVVYLLEHLFGFVSESRLKELSDTTTPLLRLLSQRAPGTMQHALQVANMAEAAARKIGGNALLARVGALYHDIGKIAHPGYFIENQTGGVNPHQRLVPIESAKVIIAHVDEGMVLAKKYKLPRLVSDFIITHHGKTQSAYFYARYCDDGGDPACIDAFTYHGRLPQTKEQVIVMIADAVEASTRSLTNHAPDRISEMVERMVSERLSGEQLSQADISIKEINTVKRDLKIRLQEVYHQRVAYERQEDSKTVR